MNSSTTWSSPLKRIKMPFRKSAVDAIQSRISS
jgi:hypothetical protein